MTPNKIAVSKLSVNYENWLRKIDNDVEIVNLYEMSVDDAVNQLKESSGLLLTGGSDVHPSHYGKMEYLPHCREIDERRDELELALIHAAFDEKIPVLGICRGLQILNVAFKGTLIPDISGFSKSSVPHSGKEDVYHRVSVKENSLLFRMTESRNEVVNSSHHQAIDSLAKHFVAVAHSPDFLIEAVEAESSFHPHCIGVQWHPERMDFSNPLSWKLGLKFLEQIKPVA
jgi:putative glutamine amidotransferase